LKAFCCEIIVGFQVPSESREQDTLLSLTFPFVINEEAQGWPNPPRDEN